MKKKILFVLTMFFLIFGVSFTLIAQDGGGTTAEKSSIWNWILTVGLGGVAAVFPTLWKRVKSVSLKIADLIMLVMDELDNVKTQVVELKTAARNLIEHYKESIEDNVLSKQEQEGFAEKFEKLVDELDDVPTAFQAAVTRIREYIKNWGSNKPTV